MHYNNDNKEYYSVNKHTKIFLFLIYFVFEFFYILEDTIFEQYLWNLVTKTYPTCSMFCSYFKILNCFQINQRIYLKQKFSTIFFCKFVNNFSYLLLWKMFFFCLGIYVPYKKIEYTLQMLYWYFKKIFILKTKIKKKIILIKRKLY